MGVVLLTMSMLVHDVLVLVLVVGMIVNHSIVRVFMVVGSAVFVCLAHNADSFHFFGGSFGRK